ncbi:hypothetical protein [Inhella gelatinilytica]|uniref:Uncharacterized protein n=1 Tax=Inhella gelatinilytica TaxID=2795030 RepID=A0A931IWD1_9BURK|nr:hypothetical protein [Inhella gelatinilytica]MBH9554032.1 hypothetical protein [Inhella gelatinilytica]
MSAHQDQAKILAFAVYELRLLLAGHLGSDNESDLSTRAAAHLAYSLHNEALAVLEGRDFDVKAAVQAIAKVDAMFGENFLQQFTEATKRAG